MRKEIHADLPHEGKCVTGNMFKNSGGDRHVCVLLSGGIDSTACAHFHRQQDCAVEGLFVNYGQVSARREIAAVRRVSLHLSLDFHAIRLCDGPTFSDGLRNGRNAFLLLSALMTVPETVMQIGIGIHAGTEYLDCGASY